MAQLVDLAERRRRREAEAAARNGNAFIALAESMRSSGVAIDEIVKAMLMASASVVVVSAEAEEARRMADGVSRAYPGMVDALIAARAAS